MNNCYVNDNKIIVTEDEIKRQACTILNDIIDFASNNVNNNLLKNPTFI